MANKNAELIKNYLQRFFEGPVFTRQKWATFWRYAGEACSVVYEKMVGLDYSMVYYTKDVNSHHSVYTKVPKKILKRIFNDIEDIENKSFIDVGCGKCYAVTKAGQRGFKRYGGVEFTKLLYDAGVSNLKKKHLTAENVYNEDAKDFDHYGDFDIFFFNNPFDETIMEPVAKKIWDTHIGKNAFYTS